MNLRDSIAKLLDAVQELSGLSGNVTIRDFGTDRFLGAVTYNTTTLLNLIKDDGDGKGLMQIHSDWGEYGYYWGAMSSDIVSFLAGTSASYVHGKLRTSANCMGMKKEYLVRLDRFMINSWPAIHAELIKRAAISAEARP